MGLLLLLCCELLRPHDDLVLLSAVSLNLKAFFGGNFESRVLVQQVGQLFHFQSVVEWLLREVERLVKARLRSGLGQVEVGGWVRGSDRFRGLVGLLRLFEFILLFSALLVGFLALGLLEVFLFAVLDEFLQLAALADRKVVQFEFENVALRFLVRDARPDYFQNSVLLLSGQFLDGVLQRVLGRRRHRHVHDIDGLGRLLLKRLLDWLEYFATFHAGCGLVADWRPGLLDCLLHCGFHCLRFVRVDFLVDKVELFKFIFEKDLEIDHFLVNLRGLALRRPDQRVDELDEIHRDLICVLVSVLLQVLLKRLEHV